LAINEKLNQEKHGGIVHGAQLKYLFYLKAHVFIVTALLGCFNLLVFYVVFAVVNSLDTV